MTRAFWHLDPENFGDTLTEWLLAKYGYDIEWSKPANANLVAVGSILEAFPSSYEGFIWGTGLIRDSPHPLPNANVLAVRGRLTATRIGHPKAPLGDPALLIAHHIPKPEPRHLLGVVPHKIHVNHPIIQSIVARAGVQLIDPREPADIVIANIGQCETILSTSLHGLITADSYGIPALWADLPDVPLAGSRDFKFHDHETAVNGREARRIVLTRDTTARDLIRGARAANPDMVAACVASLEASIPTLGGNASLNVDNAILDSPIDNVPPKDAPLFAVAITTRNRRRQFDRCLARIRKYSPPGTPIIVVDDASDEPVPEATYRFERQAGIAIAKNKCLELLDDTGAQHLFLFDDDCWPIKPNWWQPYIDSPEPHLMYIFANDRPSKTPWRIVDKDRHHVAWNRPCGCMIYLERRVLDKVGGMRPDFGLWGGEHTCYSRRIHHAGLTRWDFADIVGSGRLFYSMDEHWREFSPEDFDRSVDVALRRQNSARNARLEVELAARPEHVPYR